MASKMCKGSEGKNPQLLSLPHPISGRNGWARSSIIVIFEQEGDVFLATLYNLLLEFLTTPVRTELW
jgi:hypothetical protein